MTESYRELRALAPYLQLHRGKTFVVKLGGELLADKSALTICVDQLALLDSLGVKLVLVHGGAPQIATLCGQLGLDVVVVSGRRVTPPPVLRATAMGLHEAQLELLGALRAAGVGAAGLTGASAGLIEARQRAPMTLEVSGTLEQVDLGEVGDIVSINRGLLLKLMKDNLTPVITPLACTSDGRILNINADTVAAAVAAGLGASKIIFLMQAPGVLRDVSDPATLISELSMEELNALESSGALQGGMQPKASAVRTALQAGVPRAHLVSGVQSDALLRELLSNEGSGTMVTGDA